MKREKKKKSTDGGEGEKKEKGCSKNNASGGIVLDSRFLSCTIRFHVNS